MLRAQDYKDGQILLIDKPLSWTSFDVVNKIRGHLGRTFQIKKIKVGHAGTLDPLATGLMIVCVGKQTKNVAEYQLKNKEYIGTFTLGSSTPSYDLETKIDNICPIDHITEGLLRETAEKFTGTIEQKPPIFSAVKKDGRRLYELARAGKTTELPYREVTIYEFEITQITIPIVCFRVLCSKGTYIRSLAHDFGIAIGSAAHLSSLRRTKIGNFSVEKSQSIDSFVKSYRL